MNGNLVKQIEFILNTVPESRNSDITLTTEIWKYYFPKSLVDTNFGEAVLIRDLFDLPREDNVKRVRAKIQNEERRYLPKIGRHTSELQSQR